MTLKPESEWIYQDCSAVVSDEIFAQVGTIIAERAKSRKKRPGRRPKHLFASRLFCTCGGKMYVPSKSVKYTCRDCRAKIPADDLEAVFLNELRAFVLSPDLLDDYLSGASKELENKKRLLVALRADRDALYEEMDLLYKLYLEGEISPKQFGMRTRPLEERAEEMGREIPRLQGEIDALSIDALSGSHLKDQGVALVEGWPKLSFEDKRAIVESVVHRIEIGGGEITFDLAYLPSLELVATSLNTPHPVTHRVAGDLAAAESLCGT